MLKKLLKYIREHELLRAGERVGVAVSGGADSVALLHAIHALRDELGVVLSVVHVHHGIRGEAADEDQRFVEALARRLGLDFHTTNVDVPAHAKENGLGIEAAGRALRYEYFRELISNHTLDKIATAHTRDDQAETVLLRLLRGAGTRGLAGIYRHVSDEGATEAHIVRPLLGTSRKEIEEYLSKAGQDWREDATNQDREYMRNRVRHELLPLLERDFNPNIRQVLAETAEIAREEEAWWAEEVERQFRVSGFEFREKTAKDPHLPKDGRYGAPVEEVGKQFQVSSFKFRVGVAEVNGLAVALRRRVLREMAQRAGVALDFHHVEQLMGFVAKGAVGSCHLTAGFEARIGRERGGVPWLEIVKKEAAGAVDFEYALPVPGEVKIPELGVTLRARVVEMDDKTATLSGALIGQVLMVRNWRQGDRYHAHGRKKEEKLKELFQEYRVPREERGRWPVVTLGDRIVWVRGLPRAEEFVGKESTKDEVRMTIEEIAD